MSTPLLIAASVVVPLVWGWATHIAFERLWPPRPAPQVDLNNRQRPPGPPFDYQI